MWGGVGFVASLVAALSIWAFTWQPRGSVGDPPAARRGASRWLAPVGLLLGSCAVAGPGVLLQLVHISGLSSWEPGTGPVPTARIVAWNTALAVGALVWLALLRRRVGRCRVIAALCAAVALLVSWVSYVQADAALLESMRSRLAAVEGERASVAPPPLETAHDARSVYAGFADRLREDFIEWSLRLGSETLLEEPYTVSAATRHRVRRFLESVDWALAPLDRALEHRGFSFDLPSTEPIDVDLRAPAQASFRHSLGFSHPA